VVITATFHHIFITWSLFYVQYKFPLELYNCTY
jgi:hypothetical protein